MLFSETLVRWMRPSTVSSIRVRSLRASRAIPALSLVLAFALYLPARAAAAEDGCNESVTVTKFELEPHHDWTPPFGLDKVGAPATVRAEVESSQRLLREYYVVAYIKGQEVERKVLSIMRRTFDSTDPAAAKHGGSAVTKLETYPDELGLFSLCRFQGEPLELKRMHVDLPKIQVAAQAHATELVNAIDLGAILPPHDWLLLGPNQKTEVDAAAIAYGDPVPNAKLTAWFESAPSAKGSVALAVEDRKAARTKLTLEAIKPANGKDVLHIALVDGQGGELWAQKVQTMYVAQPPKLPAFGATELKLRYDAPISVNTAGGGKLDFISYDTAWDPKFNDVVVTMPNGGRFVFWRGSSLIPFWVGKHNTGMCYEWAETTPPPDGFVDSIEPLMDKELRYGRVEIIESTPARVHVRWTYQSTDFTYKVWGDQAVEDFYFYPDGFGTRVMSLKRKPGNEYELSEFIAITPQSAYPFEVLPKNMVDMIYLDGVKEEVLFPDNALFKSSFPDPLNASRNTPVMYRIRFHKEETNAAVYFHPAPNHYPMAPFAPFYDRGSLVTPAYWGSHWPLSRGKTTGWSIDDRIHHSPSHNSLLTWGTKNRPAPLTSGNIETINTLGKAGTMTVERWAWLIGTSNANDAKLIEWGQSFAHPPSLDVKGGELEYAAYAQERRALRLKVTDRNVTVTLTPIAGTVNPVFELANAPKSKLDISIDGQPVPQNRYAWDGKTLWIEATLSQPTKLELKFASGN